MELKKAASVSQRPPLWLRRRPMQAFFVVVILLGLVIIATPFSTLILYRLQGPPSRLPYPSILQEFGRLPGINDQAESETIPEGRRLVIPKIGVDIAIVEGRSESALWNGAWRIPTTSASPMDGNMVLSAHRFRYRPPSSETFYLLDQLVEGDIFIVYWDGVEYDYQITGTRIVDPTEVSILNATDSRQITLFTCTPLFSTRQRLVVVGTPLEPTP